MIEITYDNFTVEKVNTLQEAKESILEAHANGIQVEQVTEVDDEGDEVKAYGCEWSVELEELDG